MMSFILSFVFMMTVFNSNSLPIIIIMMIFLSILVFSSLWMISGSCWFPLIFSLLFVGGILVLFMVISSLFPNMKNFFFPSFSSKFFIVFSFFLLLFSESFSSVSPFMVKYYSITGGNFYTLIFIILSYFFCFLYFISKDKVSLRSFF